MPTPFKTIRHEYEEQRVELHFFRCKIETGLAAPLDCDEIRWVLPREMLDLRFPPADRPIIDALQQEVTT